ncbi:hypothetical protein CEUSTIGMA_g2680.t1 [Chlamydomonas eustigma]|uniref:PRA1 family protein n=1 Tax=Chlamydomonas eustigma TaxID=1157962 RepID=A0A250WWR3_9CHLO|nr:hypothetical protein CEUSTIGMA_g2680.t1 [Chlamydomonas eustigma]|eukprot:GAX75235.1 hypothetical protein CEUSTIGMA_g2680.t1 [Chlamydomonas eustigma]
MSAPSPPSASASATAPPTGAPSALNTVINRIKDSSYAVIKLQKPWSEVFDRTVLSKPSSFGEALTRVKKNSAYFRVNYLIVMLTTTLATFLLHPTALIILGLLIAGWIWVIFIKSAPLVIGGRTLSDRETLIAMSGISFITIFFLTSVGAVFFSALSLSVAIVVLHGAFREPDNLFLDEAESQQPFLSFLTGSTAGVTIPAAMAAV